MIDVSFIPEIFRLFWNNYGVKQILPYLVLVWTLPRNFYSLKQQKQNSYLYCGFSWICTYGVWICALKKVLRHKNFKNMYPEHSLENKIALWKKCRQIFFWRLLKVVLFQKHSFSYHLTQKITSWLFINSTFYCFCLHYIENTARKTIKCKIAEKSQCHFLG